MLQIAVIGNSDPRVVSPSLLDAAEEVGTHIGKNQYILVCGGLSGVMSRAAKGAHEAGGTVVGIIPYTEKKKANEYCDHVICTDWKTRPHLIISSSDAVIALGGGVGTLEELCIAYDAGKPVVVLEVGSGWAEKIDGFLDERETIAFVHASSPAEAVQKAAAAVQKAAVQKTSVPPESYWQTVERGLSENTLHTFWGPKIVQIEPTNRCNLQCIMCSRWKWQAETAAGDALSTSRLLSLFEELELMGTTLVLFSGGEPFLREDIFDIIRFAHKRHIKTGIFTNGTLINQEKAEMITGLGTDVCVSVDGSTSAIHDRIRNVKGAFQRAVSGIAFLIKARNAAPKGEFTTNVGMNAVIQEGNLDDIPAYYLLGKELGIDFVRYNLVHGDSPVTLGENPREQLKKSLEELHTIKDDLTVFECPFVKGVAEGTIDLELAQKGRPSLHLMEENPMPCFKSFCYSLIDAFGRVYPCTHTYFDNQSYQKYEENRKSYYLGSILEDSFYHIWNGPHYMEFRRNMNPVNVALHRSTCGQCEQVFEFKKLHDILTRLRNGDTDLPSPDRVKYEFELLW